MALPRQSLKYRGTQSLASLQAEMSRICPYSWIINKYTSAGPQQQKVQRPSRSHRGLAGTK